MRTTTNDQVCAGNLRVRSMSDHHHAEAMTFPVSDEWAARAHADNAKYREIKNLRLIARAKDFHIPSNEISQYVL